MSKNKTHGWLGLVAAGLMAVVISGCGGGSDGAAGPAGQAGATGPAGPAGPAGPPGATGTVNVAFVTPEEWEASQFSATVDSVNTSGKPVVEFTVLDARGRPVEGLETLTSKSATATVAQYPNVSFAMAKLMPRTDARIACSSSDGTSDRVGAVSVCMGAHATSLLTARQ